MSKIPEGVETTTAEGDDLSAAIEIAAKALDAKPHQVAHSIDMSHFRNAAGRSVPRDTVKIIAWVNPDAPEEAPKGGAPSKPRRSRSDDDDRGRRSKRDDGGRRDGGGRRDDGGRRGGRHDAPEGSTEASDFAEEWFTTLIDYLGVEGEVSASGNDDRVHIRIKPSAKAGRLIGRRGSTLAAIRHLLGLALEAHGGPSIDIDVDDDRGGKGKDRSRDRDRDDRKGRGRSKGRGRRDDDKGGYDEDKLRALARRAADKAKSSGKTITINLDLSSYDRRIVHMEVSEIDGVDSQSAETDDGKRIQVIPE